MVKLSVIFYFDSFLGFLPPIYSQYKHTVYCFKTLERSEVTLQIKDSAKMIRAMGSLSLSKISSSLLAE